MTWDRSGNIKPGRVVIVGLSIFLSMLSACETGGSSASSVRDRMAAGDGPSTPGSDDAAESTGTSKVDRPAAESSSTPSRPVAVVNGEEIARRDLITLLIETRGLLQLQQLVLARLAEQEARRLNLTITPADIEHEYELTLEADRFNGKDKDKLTPARKEQLIADWLRTRGISRMELDIAIRRQAHLRKIAEGHVRILPEMIEREYRIKHGPRVEVRHIQLGAPRAWPSLKERIDRGDDFEKLVRDFSENILTREKGGLMPPIAREEDPTVPPIFAKVAFELSAGQVSSLFEAEGSFHVLKVERFIPADDVSMDSVRAELEKALHARLIAQEMQALGEQLLTRSKLLINDPVLKKQYEERLKKGEIIGPPLQSR